MSNIITKLKKVLSRSAINKSEKLAREDILNNNKDDIITDISQRRGLHICSGLSIAERDYILSDAMITSAIQLYVADVTAICSRDNYRIISNVSTDDNEGENSKFIEKINYVFNQIFSDKLIESIIINLLNNGEIFLETEYSYVKNKIDVNETAYSRCTQLLYKDGDVACYVVSNIPFNDDNAYNYNLSFNSSESKLISPEKMVRIYNPTLVNSKVCIELDTDEKSQYADVLSDNEYLYYTNSLSLLKQIYPDWLNGKLLELAVYRDRIAKSRFIQLIRLELGRTSRITSDQIYDNVKDYFDKRSVIDLEQQTFKSVVGNEPFTDYKVYTTRNGIGQISFDSSLEGSNTDVSSLADLEYNLTKVFAGLGIPKQYLGADDNGSALSNGGSLFFISEKYQKRVIAYVKRIAYGLKECIKNIMIQQDSENTEIFTNFDFDIVFNIPENNEDIYRVKNARLDYTNAILDLVDKIITSGDRYSTDAISNSLQEDIESFISVKENNEKEGETEDVRY